MASENVIGLVLAIVAAICSNFGVNVQKSAHKKTYRLSADQKKEYYALPQWWLGFFLVFAGAIGDFLALGFASQSLVAAVGGGSTLLANVFIGYFFNKEDLFRTDIIGIGAITTAVVLASSIALPPKKYDLATLKKLFANPAFIVYISLQFVVMLALLLIITGYTIDDLFKMLKDKIRRICCRAKVSSSEAAPSAQQPVDGYDMHHHSRPLAHTSIPYYYAMFSGMFGAMSVQLGGCVAKVFLTTVHGDNQFIYSGTYLFVAGMIFTLIIQTHFLNKALATGDVMSVFPVFQVFWIGFSVVAGIIFYQELAEFELIQWILYPVALVFGGIGIYFLTAHGKNRDLEYQEVPQSDELSQELLKDSKAPYQKLS